MKICSRCVLPETFPGIRFDRDGVCSICRREERQPDPETTRAKMLDRFEELVAIVRQQPGLHAVVAYSGGKDSTYVLDLLARRHRLRVLAVTLDNGFMPPAVLVNARTVCDHVGADHMVYRPTQAVAGRVFLEAARRPLYALQAAQRASDICTACMGLVKQVVTRTAVDRRVPLVAYAWSPGQAPVRSAILSLPAASLRSMERSLLDPMREVVAEAATTYELPQELPESKDLPTSLSPLLMLEYDEADVIRRAEEIGWKRPTEIDPTSTNCQLNSLGIAVHLERYGFHPYASEMARLVRLGSMEREEALAKLEAVPDQELVSRIRQQLERWSS